MDIDINIDVVSIRHADKHDISFAALVKDTPQNQTCSYLALPNIGRLQTNVIGISAILQ
jgi:hypothetical protein